jgi:uncharacterized protein involved in exopolysaccharide biosynthesis/Mrp family chromosome partitioning ATPase
MSHASNLQRWVEPDPAYSGEPDDGFFSQAFAALWRGKWLILGAVVVAIAAAAAYLHYATPMYRSNAELFIQVPSSDNPRSQMQTAPFAGATLAAHVRKLQSSPVLAEALREPGIMDGPLFADAERPIEVLRNHLEVEAWESENVLSISFESPDAEESAVVVNAVISAYVSSYQPFQRTTRDATMQALERSARLLDDPQAEAATTLAVLDAGQPDQAMDHEVFDSGNVAVVEMRLRDLGRRLTEAQLETMEAEALMAAAQALPDAGPVQLRQLVASHAPEALALEGEPGGLTLQDQLMTEMRFHDSLIERFGPQHRSVVQSATRVEQLRTQLIERDRAEALAYRQQIVGHRDRAVDRERQLAIALSAQQQRAMQIDALPFEVIEAAIAPDEPTSPQEARILAMALILGLFTGGGVALLRDHHRPGPLAADARGRSLELVDPSSTELTALPAPAPDDPPLLGAVPDLAGQQARGDGQAVTALAIHEVRVMLQLHTKATGARSFAVTSPTRGSGRTSVAAGVAASLAMTGKRTLVVDTDLAGRMFRDGHARRLGAVAQQSNHEALAESVAAATHGSAAPSFAPAPTTSRSDASGFIGMLEGRSLAQCVAKTGKPGLDVLPAVGVTPEHIGRLDGQTIRRLLDESAHDYDVVLFDTGPIPGSMEALLVAAEADAALVVTNRGEARARLDRTLGQLRVIGACVLGTVFNRAGCGDVSVQPLREARGDEPIGGSGIIAAAVEGPGWSGDEADDSNNEAALRQLERDRAEPSSDRWQRPLNVGSVMPPMTDEQLDRSNGHASGNGQHVDRQAEEAADVSTT